MIKFNDSVRDRFIRYTTYDTMSDGNASGNRRPTTEGQEELLLVLKKELEELGLETYYGEEKVVRVCKDGPVFSGEEVVL